EASKKFDIPAQALSSALVTLATQADISIGLTGVVLTNQVSSPVTGNRTVSQALGDLLAGTGLASEMVDDGIWRIYRRPQLRDVKLETPTIPLTLPPIEEIVVTAI